MEDEREQKLPHWAQCLIKFLRAANGATNGPLLRELETLRPQVEKLRNRNSALILLLECAAKGGHVTSAEIMAELRAHELIE